MGAGDSQPEKQLPIQVPIQVPQVHNQLPSRFFNPTIHSNLELASALYPNLPKDLLLSIVKYNACENPRMLLARLQCEYMFGANCKGTFVCPECSTEIEFLWQSPRKEFAERQIHMADIVRDHISLHPDCDIRIYNKAGERMT